MKRHVHLITRPPGQAAASSASGCLTADEAADIIQEGDLTSPHGLLAALAGEADAAIDRRPQGSWIAVAWCSGTSIAECATLCLAIGARAEGPSRNPAQEPEPGHE